MESLKIGSTIFLPPKTATFVTVPWASQVDFRNSDTYWHLNGSPALSYTVTGAAQNRNLALFNKSAVTVRSLTNYQPGSTHSFWVINNIMAFIDNSVNKGIGWDVITSFTLLYGIDGLFVKQPLYVPPAQICWPEGGISCADTLGPILNALDDTVGATITSGGSSCSGGNNPGATIWLPQRTRGFYSSDRQIQGPLITPDTAVLYDQTRSAYLGANMIATVEDFPGGTQGNLIKVYKIVSNSRNGGACTQNQIEFAANPIYSLDLTQTPYRNDNVTRTRIIPVGRGTFLLHNRTGTNVNNWLLFQFPGPVVAVMQYVNSSLDQSNYKSFVDPSGALIIGNFGTPPVQDIGYSNQIFDININLRLPSYADPMYVNGTDTITIL